MALHILNVAGLLTLFCCPIGLLEDLSCFQSFYQMEWFAVQKYFVCIQEKNGKIEFAYKLHLNTCLCVVRRIVYYEFVSVCIIMLFLNIALHTLLFKPIQTYSSCESKHIWVSVCVKAKQAAAHSSINAIDGLVAGILKETKLSKEISVKFHIKFLWLFLWFVS